MIARTQSCKVYMRKMNVIFSKKILSPIPSDLIKNSESVLTIKQLAPMKTNAQSYIDGLTNENDTADMLREKYRLNLDDSDFEPYKSDRFTANIPYTEKVEFIILLV